MFDLRSQGFSVVPIRHDKTFESVILSDRFKSKDIYVIGLNYKEHKSDSLLRKALLCDSKFTFDPQIAAIIAQVKTGHKKLNISYRCGGNVGTISYHQQEEYMQQT